MSGKINELIKKSRQSLKEEGVGGFLRKAKNWTIYQLKTDKRKEAVKDILFVNGCALPHPGRYRVLHQIEQIEANGLSADQVFYTLLKPEMIKYYRCVVFFRCPFTDAVGELIELAHYYNKKVFFDVDDLVVDKKYTDEIEYIQNMSDEQRKEYDDGVIRMGRTMEKCDYLITTTNALKRELEKKGKEVFVNRNVASEEMVRLSLDAVKKTKKDSDEVTVGYLSGSITHNADFELIKPALIRILDEYPNVRLVLMGYLDLPEDLKQFRKQIIIKPFSNWKKLPAIIAGLDINLAPIEKTIFNEAKSENKWMEAALCGVATIASNYGAFRDVIDNNKTGVLCDGVDEWYKCMKKLIESKDLRDQIGGNAQEVVFKKYITTYTGLGLVRFIESKLNRNIGFVLPSTNVSGGVNVVVKHCNILRKNGWDVTVVNMDANDENVKNSDGEINVVSGVLHDFMMRFDTLVATLYTTVDYIKRYPDVSRRCYLVQGFETDICDYGSPVKKVANATYNVLSGVEYITVSKWCKKWLFDEYGKDAKYVPNGIDLGSFDFKKRRFDGKIKILVEGNCDDYYKNVDESFRVIEMLDRTKYEIMYLSYHGKPKDWYIVDKFYHQVPHEKIGEIYASADILLKSSILESFSYPPLEMMATGGYVVVVPNDGNREYLRNRENCLFYERGNIQDAVEKIEEIIGDKDLRKHLTNGAKETIKHRDWKDIEKRVLELYE